MYYKTNKYFDNNYYNKNLEFPTQLQPKNSNIFFKYNLKYIL